MSKTIAVLGANGVYARHLIPKLTAAGHSVRAVVRRPEAAGIARASGAMIATGDIFDVASMTVAFEGCSIALNLATSLPGPSGRGDFAANDKLRIEGVPNFVAACRNAGVAKIMQQSIGWVAASGNSDWTDEDAVYRPAVESISTRAIAAALTMEQTIKASHLDWIILRGGLFYGPGTGFDDGWYARAAAGKLRLPGDGYGLCLARPYRGHGVGNGRCDRKMAVAFGPDRLRQRTGTVARSVRIHLCIGRHERAESGRTAGLSFVPASQCARGRGTRLAAVLQKLSRGARALRRHALQLLAWQPFNT